jgi:hypothetical protein
MSISAVGSAPVSPVSLGQTGGPAPSNDGDGNDEASGTEASVQAAPAPGAGTVIDKTA